MIHEVGSSPASATAGGLGGAIVAPGLDEVALGVGLGDALGVADAETVALGVGEGSVGVALGGVVDIVGEGVVVGTVGVGSAVVLSSGSTVPGSAEAVALGGSVGAADTMEVPPTQHASATTSPSAVASRTRPNGRWFSGPERTGTNHPGRVGGSGSEGDR